MARTFRFGIQTSRAPSGEEWTEKARKIEELGYATLLMPDHFEDQLSPVPALMAAADATTSLRVGTLVFDNDFKHPVVLAKELATLDLLSSGRLEIGIGAGWMRTDYDQSGLTYDSPGTRIGRLAEALKVLKGSFAEGPFSYSGRHYTISNYDGRPKPVQKPHPSILIGGGGRRLLTLAAQEADIIGVNFNLGEGVVNPAVAATGSAQATAEKIAWVRKAAGDRFEDLELNATVFFSNVTDDRAGLAGRVAQGFGMTPADVLASPHTLMGPIDQLVDDLQQRREEYGFSYIVFSGDVHEQMAPLVKRLAGT